jgi:hypothetical protein
VNLAGAGEVGAANWLGEAVEDRFAGNFARAGEVGAANQLGEAVEDRFARNYGYHQRKACR